MAKRLGQSLLDSGLGYPAARATAGDTIKLRIVKAYSAGDSHSTVVSNTVAAVSMAAGDLVVGADSSTGRKLTTAEKTAVPVTADTGSSPDLHVVLTDDTGTAEVLAVTDETSNIVLSVGGGSNTVTIPACTWAIAFAAS